MNLRLLSLPAGIALVGSTAVFGAETAGLRAERLGAAFLLAQGRAPTPAELQDWTGTTHERTSLADLLARQGASLRADAATQRAALARAWRDALGRAPTEPELAAETAVGGLYVAALQRHLDRLASHPDEYKRALDRAYDRVLGRAPFALEYDYWAARPPLTYVLLVGCVGDWARRNAPGLMATTGSPSICVNSEYLVTLRLSPAVAAEARAAAGLPATDAPGWREAREFDIVAPGAGAVASVGGIHFLAVGPAAPAP